MLQDLRNKVAVVTGGASGIGKGIATQLAEEGMKLVIGDIEDEPLRRTAAELGATGIRTDVSDPASVDALARAACDLHGTVHLVCNNAGVGSVATIADMKLSDWRWMIGVNLWGVIHGVTTFLPILRANPDGGHIVNTASIGGLATMSTLGAYTVTKFGVVALSEVLAQELVEENSKVGVTVLCPGTVRTNIKTSSRNRPGDQPGGLTDVDLEQGEYGASMRWIDPDEVGRIVVDAIKAGDLYALTHPDMEGPITARHAAIAGAFEKARARG